MVVAGTNLHFGVLAVKPGKVHRGVDHQFIPLAPQRAVNRARGPIDIKLVGPGIGFVGLAAAEEARLLHLRTTLLGTENIAVAALVARIGVVGQLMRLHDAQNAARNAADCAGKQFEVVVLDGFGARLVREVGVVGADRHALVAVDAIVKPELRRDLARHAPVALPRVARIGGGFGHEDRRVEQAGRVHVASLAPIPLHKLRNVRCAGTLHLGGEIVQVAA